MTASTTSESSRRTRTGMSRGVGVPIAVMLTAAVALLGSLSMRPANADTPTTHTIQASTDTSPPSITQPGPLTGLSNGQVVTIKVTQASTSDPINSLPMIRQCENNAPIGNVGDMGPSNTGYCLATPFNSSSDAVKTGAAKASLTDNFIQTTFRVGTGTEQVTFDAGSGNQNNTITCDSTHDCSLWIEIGRTGGNDFVHYNLKFGSGGTTTTTAATTTTTAATTTTTAATTTTHPTTTTTAATTTTTGGGTTTTTAAGGTTTTVGSTTTTTLPAGTTVSPATTGAGGTVAVSSTGWQASSTVQVILHSNPVSLPSMVADATGKISGTVTIPASTTAGAHTLEFKGTSTSGAARDFSAGLVVTAASTSSSSGATSSTVATTATTVSTGSSGLAATGSNILKVLLSALLIGLSGWLLLVSAVHRRDRLGSAR